MKLKRIFQTSLITGVAICIVSVLGGCGNTTTPAVSTLTQQQRIAVLTSIANAQKDVAQGVIGSSTTVNIASLQGLKTPRFDIAATTVSTANKATYDHGTQEYRVINSINDNGSVSTISSYVISTTSSNINGTLFLDVSTDVYTNMAFPTYQTNIHILQRSLTNSTREIIAMSRANGTVTYTNGTVLTLINASLNSTADITIVNGSTVRTGTTKLTYPVSFQYDADANGTSETYTATFVGVNLPFEQDPEKFLSADVFESNGAKVGSLKLFMSGELEIALD